MWVLTLYDWTTPPPGHLRRPHERSLAVCPSSGARWQNSLAELCLLVCPSVCASEVVASVSHLCVICAHNYTLCASVTQRMCFVGAKKRPRWWWSGERGAGWNERSQRELFCTETLLWRLPSDKHQQHCASHKLDTLTGALRLGWCFAAELARKMYIVFNIHHQSANNNENY